MDPQMQTTGPRVGNGSARVQTEEDHRVGHLLARLGRETYQLVRQETALATKELGENLTEARHGLVALATSLAIMVPGVTVLLVAAGYGLALYMPTWMSMLIVGGGALLIGAVLALVGKKQVEWSNIEPTKTRESLRENKRFIEEQVAT